MASRRLLLAQMAQMANLTKWLWLPYTEYAPLYDSLVPTTIDGKLVRNKARVLSIAGNSVVMNQLVDANDTSITLGTHEYLTYISGTWSIITGTNQTLSVNGGTDMVIDLTKMFPFDTPTTLSDPRVQKLISMGYIPHNSGEIVDSAVRKITCESNGSRIGTLQLPAPLQLGGVNTAKNTFEITDDGYVFTRRKWRVDLSTINFTYSSTDNCWIGIFSGVKIVNDSTPINAISDNYEIVKASGYTTSHDNFTLAMNTSNQIFIDNNSTTITPTGTLDYELATPQVITIPRKHLGVERIRDLYWFRITRYINPYFKSMSLPYIKTGGECYCEAYQTINNKNNTNEYTFGKYASNKSITIAGSATDEVVYIRADDCTEEFDLRAKYGDCYIFYETKDEVPDFDDKLTIEAGGTLNADSDVLADVAFDFKCEQ